MSSDKKADASFISYEITSATIFGNHSLRPGYEAAYSGAFREFKIHRIDAHYMPFQSMIRDGEYCFLFADSGEIATSLLNTFNLAVGSPGSVVRKAYQPARLSWFPTESDDRNWHPFSDGHYWCTVGLSCAGFSSDQSLGGKIIADLDISFRGKPDEFSMSAEMRSEVDRCYCRKCRRIRAQRSRILHDRERLPRPHTESGVEERSSVDQRSRLGSVSAIP